MRVRVYVLHGLGFLSRQISEFTPVSGLALLPQVHLKVFLPSQQLRTSHRRTCAALDADRNPAEIPAAVFWPPHDSVRGRDATDVQSFAPPPPPPTFLPTLPTQHVCFPIGHGGLAYPGAYLLISWLKGMSDPGWGTKPPGPAGPSLLGTALDATPPCAGKALLWLYVPPGKAPLDRRGILIPLARNTQHIHTHTHIHHTPTYQHAHAHTRGWLQLAHVCVGTLAPLSVSPILPPFHCLSSAIRSLLLRHPLISPRRVQHHTECVSLSSSAGTPPRERQRDRKAQGGDEAVGRPQDTPSWMPHLPRCPMTLATTS